MHSHNHHPACHDRPDHFGPCVDYNLEPINDNYRRDHDVVRVAYDDLDTLYDAWNNFHNGGHRVDDLRAVHDAAAAVLKLPAADV